MDVAEDLYVAKDLYEDDEVETGIRRGVSPTRDGGPSPPRVQAMEVDSGTRTLVGLPQSVVTRHEHPKSVQKRLLRQRVSMNPSGASSGT